MTTRTTEELIGLRVTDDHGDPVGIVDGLWLGPDGAPLGLAVDCGWFVSDRLVVPAGAVDRDRTGGLRVAAGREDLVRGPRVPRGADLEDERLAAARRHYGVEPSKIPDSSAIITSSLRFRFWGRSARPIAL